jgi:hypothetical protein
MKTRTTLLGSVVGLAVASLVVLGVAAAGCGSEPQFAETPPPPDAAPPPPPPPPVADAAPVATTPTPCDPVQLTAMTTMFQGRAPTEAVKMDQVGGIVCGVAGQGMEVTGETFMIDQGYCYTILGQGMPNVTDVDVRMELDVQGIPPALQAFQIKPVLAVDTSAGVTTAVGGGANCYKWTFPISAPAKLIVTAKAGEGPVAAQVYRKKAPL